MLGSRRARRTKSLDVELIGPDRLHFRLELDDKSYSDEGDELIHSLAIEGELSLPDLTIRTIEPIAYHQPYRECGASLEPVRQLAGTRIGPGFRDKVLQVMGRTRGCTHFLTLALDLAGAHTLSVFLRMRQRASFASRLDPDGDWMRVGLQVEPRLENACTALRTGLLPMEQAKRAPPSDALNDRRRID